MSESAAQLELEIKLAFLERANAELSDVVYQQACALEGLQQRVQALEAQLEAMLEAMRG